MDSLPKELIAEIVKHVSLWDFKQLAPTCCRFNLALHEDKLWQQFCKSYEIPVLDNSNYIGAIKDARNGEWVSELDTKSIRWGDLFYNKLNKLNPKCGLSIWAHNTTLTLTVKTNTTWYTILIVHDEIIRMKGYEYKFDLKRGDDVSIKNNYEKESIEIYYNGKYITETKLLVNEQNSLRPYITLSRGIMETF